VTGFGTIPDCIGLDHDDFIDPGAEIEISFERLGTLRCRFAEPVGKLLPSRWPLRPAPQKFHDQYAGDGTCGCCGIPIETSAHWRQT
jgi:hypothetical protein